MKTQFIPELNQLILPFLKYLAYSDELKKRAIQEYAV